MQHVFLVGAKSLGAYGGYETFINKLTEYHQSNPDIKYHVAVKANGQGASVPNGLEVVNGRYTYHNADCFQIKIPEKLGPAQAIYYDCKALGKAIEIIKKEKIEKAIVYVMACRIGPFFGRYVREIKRLGGRVFLNPDCQTAHCGRYIPHFDFSAKPSPIVPYRHLPQSLSGMTADCRSLV